MSLTPRFHTLSVRDIRRETTDAVSITFTIPDALQTDFGYQAGQYLTLRATLEGEDLRRSYSICSAPDDGELRIAVKQVPGGAFSTWVNTELKPGDRIEVMTPTGRFGTVPPGEGPRTHVGFAAGSGITPILSIIRATLAREPESRFFLFYGNRTSNDMLFREALEELKDRYLNRFSVFHVLSREQQDIDILNGRLDRAKLERLLRHLVPAAAIDHAYVCGPTEMSEEIDATLRDLGLTEEQIHIERFVSAHGGRPRAAPPPIAAQQAACIASLVVDGARTDVPVAAGEAVLDAALRAGLDLPYACKGGMCSTCRARVVEGAVEMALNYSLEPWELKAGFVLTCQAHPTTDRVVIDYDSV
jgi:ring-1,2-phenylacetyl-CoA epoxidase subunit PaaE